MNYERPITDDSAERLSGTGYGAPESEGSFGMRVAIAAFVILLALIAAAAIYFKFLAADTTVADDSSQAPVVTVIAPGQTTVEGIISAPGTIAARREMPVGVAGEGGRVVRVNVDAGQWVEAGQVLAVIDRSVQTQQLEALAAQLEVSRADAQIAQANLDRSLQLVERGFVSAADVDRLTATRDAARARVRVSEAQLNERRARNTLLNIVAPASGLVLSRNVEPGQTVSAGSGALFRMARGGEMEMLAQVSETDLAGLKQGAPATVVPTGTSKEFTGQIWQLSPVIDPQNRQGIARIALPYAPELRPGGFGTAQIRGGSVVATILPESAVLADDDGSFVYIVGEGDVAEQRRVQTGMVTDRGIAIVEGLDGSELVVLRAGGFLNPGETINPQRQED